jgi:hypothetical protein
VYCTEIIHEISEKNRSEARKENHRTTEKENQAQIECLA